MRKIPLVLGCLVSLAACGEPPPPAAPPAPTSEPVVVPVTEAQLLLAHFKTTDGMHGFVLDRSGAVLKLQIDGSSDVVELTKKEDRHAGELRGYWLLTPDGKQPVYISKGGSLRYYTGRDEFAVTPDRVAKPLPEPTVKGQYVPPKPAYEATVERLTGIAVLAKQPGMKPEDSAHLGKVREAIEHATADMFVRYEAHGQDSWLARPAPVPDAFSGTEFGGVAHQTDEKWDPSAKGLPKWGGKLEGFSHPQSKGNHMQVMKMAGYPPKLADHTPGLVWEVNGTSAVFVTLDGGRYTVDLSNADKGQTLEPGAGPSAKWPAPLQAALLDVHWVDSYAKAGAMPKKASEDLLKLDDEWNACAQKVWKGADQRIEMTKFNEADRKAFVAKARKACKKSVDAQEKLFLKLIEERAKERTELLEKAKAKVAQVGADK